MPIHKESEVYTKIRDDWYDRVRGRHFVEAFYPFSPNSRVADDIGDWFIGQIEKILAMTEKGSAPKKVVQKYTVREVFDSLSYSVVDCDDDFDGFLHIASDLNGEEVKIPIKGVIDCIIGKRITSRKS